MEKLILGTRGSKLAIAQSSWVAKEIEAATGVPVELKIITTRGDVVLDKPLAEIGGKGLFTYELEQELLHETIDFAVHSCKDLPTENPEGLDIVCYPKREDPRDALVGQGLRDGLVIGTGSARRQAQIQRLFKGEFKGIRGNVDTRIRKMEEGQYDSVVLAMAGLNRIEIQRDDVFPLTIRQCVPAPAQGALALQAKSDRTEVIDVLKQIECSTTRVCVEGERHFLHLIGGGCHAALGAHAYPIHNGIRMFHVFYQEGDKIFEFEKSTENDDNVKGLAEICAQKIFEAIGQ